MRIQKLQLTILLGILFASFNVAHSQVITTDDNPSSSCTDEVSARIVSVEIDECTVTLTGKNEGSNIQNPTYIWSINGGNPLQSGSNNTFTYIADSPGETINVTLEITVPVNGGSICSDTTIESNIDLSCPEDDKPTVIIGIDPGSGNNKPCPSQITYQNEGGGDLCTGGLASLFGVNNADIDQVDWTWSLGTETGTITTGDRNAPIYYPVGDWTGYNLYICATLTFNNQTPCEEICETFLLDCTRGNPSRDFNNQIIKLKTYPNPFENFIYLESPESKVINRVEIYNTFGTKIKSLPYSEGIPIGIERGVPGLYFAKVYFEDGTIETVQLIKK